MELYRKVRLACRDGMSEGAAARHFGVSRESVRKMLEFSVPPGYRRTAPVRRPKLDGFTGLIDERLRRDRDDDHRKRRHTAKRIFERLRDEHGFTAGYTIVKDYVRAHHRRRREMYVPLAHPPGHGQADFGQAWAFIGGVKRKVHFFAFDLPQSDASYVRAYPVATAEAWVDGHVHAFSFFGGVAFPGDFDGLLAGRDLDEPALVGPPDEGDFGRLNAHDIAVVLRATDAALLICTTLIHGRVESHVSAFRMTDAGDPLCYGRDGSAAWGQIDEEANHRRGDFGCRVRRPCCGRAGPGSLRDRRSGGERGSAQGGSCQASCHRTKLLVPRLDAERAA